MNDKVMMYDENGNLKECIILAIIQNKYIVYTDDNHKVLASKFKEFNNEFNPFPLDTIDWVIVEKQYEKIRKQVLGN